MQKNQIKQFLKSELCMHRKKHHLKNQMIHHQLPNPFPPFFVSKSGFLQKENGIKCLEQFSNQDALRHHISNKHVLGLYYCCKCDKQLNNRYMIFTFVKKDDLLLCLHTSKIMIIYFFHEKVQILLATGFKFSVIQLKTKFERN